MNISLRALAVAGAFLSAATAVRADVIYHAPHPALVPVAGSVSTDGWNELNRPGLGCADSTCSTALLVAGITANVTGSGDAVLARTAGSFYPAGFGLYGGGTLTFTDSTVASGLQALVFQGVFNNFDSAPFSLTLSYNGGTQALAPDSVTFVNTGQVADVYTMTWNVGTLGTQLSSYTLSLGAVFAQGLGFQIDQVTAVPEPGAVSLMLAGLGIVALVMRRRPGS